MPENSETAWTEADIVELCARPEYSGTDYCRDHLPGESPSAFNERRLREQDAPLEVTVREGVSRAGLGAMWPIAAALGVGILVAYLTRGR